MYAVNSKSKNKEVAKELAFFLSNEFAQYWCMIGSERIPPTLKSFYENEELMALVDYPNSFPAIQEFIEHEHPAKKIPDTTKMYRFYEIVENLGVNLGEP